MKLTNIERALLIACVLVLVLFFGGIVLLINGVVVKSVHENAFPYGTIMLFVENGSSSDGVVATFDALAVRTAPNRLPS